MLLLPATFWLNAVRKKCEYQSCFCTDCGISFTKFIATLFKILITGSKKGKIIKNRK